MKSLLKLSLAGLTALILTAGVAFLPSAAQAALIATDLILVESQDNALFDSDTEQFVESFTVGDKIFADFTCADNSTTGGTASCEGISITLDPDAPFGWEALAISGFGGSGTSGTSSDIFITYTVTATDGLIHDLVLTFNGNVTTIPDDDNSTGFITIVENYSSCTNPGDVDACILGDLAVLDVASNGVVILSANIILSEAVSFVFVTKDISAACTGSSACTYSLSSFTQKFSQIPEPATLGLLGIGLAGLGFLMRRRRKTAAK